jgi:anaerobic sulfite reductase subunit B
VPAEVPVPYLVRGRRRETPDTVTLDLAPLTGPPAGFTPGQFNMLYAFGVGEVPVSVSGRSDGGVLHTIRAVGAVTSALCGTGEGGTVGVRGPFGRGWDLDGATGHDVVVVAGGVGLAPLRHAVLRLAADRSRYERVVLVVGARSDAALLFRDELESWRRSAALDVHLTVDHAGPAWREHVGVVTELLPALRLDPARTTALLCGPEVMMRLTALALAGMGVPAHRVQLSLERNMKCAVARCGHCQLAPVLLCRDGPVLTWDHAEPLLAVRQL